jgi:hypothetical protein
MLTILDLNIVIMKIECYVNICLTLSYPLFNIGWIDSLWVNVAVSLASIEMHFPPSFFDIMIHLLYHLVDELDLCGPVATIWMYLMEWYIKP